MGEREKLTTYINGENKQKLKEMAVKEKCSVADIVDKLVKEYLEKNYKEKDNQK